VLGLEDAQATAVPETAAAPRVDALGVVHVNHDGVGVEAGGRRRGFGGVLAFE
jgi:hypothetical protein